MIAIDMPDPLTWQSGTEYGLLGLARLVAQGQEVSCRVPREGPLLEAMGLAVHQLELEGIVTFDPDPQEPDPTRICLLPRVYPLGGDEIDRRLAALQVVVTSDPGVTIEHERLHVFPRREWRDLVTTLLSAAGSMS
jgi:hypothetical protein